VLPGEEPRISSVRTLSLSRPHELSRQWSTYDQLVVKADCALVLVETDRGHFGVGEACAYGVPSVIADWVEWLGRALVGSTVDEARMFGTPTGRSWGYDCAVAGLDCALWDLRGKLLGMRVCDLLSHEPREKVPVYASGGVDYDWRVDPRALLDEVPRYVERGFAACKIRLGTHWAWDDVTPARFLALVRDLRRMLPPTFSLMVDGNQRLTRREAFAVGEGLEELGCAWFEEPIPQGDVDGYAELNDKLEIPISGGEQLTTAEQFRRYLDAGALAIVQPDAGWCGVSELLKIAELARSYGVRLAPHSWHNGVLALTHAHVLAAIPDSGPLELCMVQGPLQTEILRTGLPVEAGELRIPAALGFGVELADGLEERFPYVDGAFNVVLERSPTGVGSVS
jgi:L-alanine-DL-glutamate epimerase-like enolase superfamily enzyme